MQGMGRKEKKEKEKKPFLQRKENPQMFDNKGPKSSLIKK